MAYDINPNVQSRVINALFDTKSAADTAVDRLVAAGIPRQHISETGGRTTTETGEAPGEEKGFWESLKELFLPEEDRYTYAEGLRRGGYLVSVRADEANYGRVLDILDDEGSVDMDEREGQWRTEGWTGYAGEDLAASAASGLTTARPLPTTNATDSTLPLEERNQTSTPSSAYASGVNQPAGGDKVSLYEENLRVGKRDVNHGRVRLRSYVVETPVNEQVNLRQERVVVDRQPVDRPVTAGDTLFQDRTIEAEEHAEEAVISKEARVKEEVSLRKTTENRPQTISDTVRHTELDVQDERGGATGASGVFSATRDASRIVPHMDVISADGQKIGTVDHLDGPDRIKLAKNTSPDGQHHLVPLTWIDHVDQHVHLKKTLADIKAGV